jgi:broad specificity phosphatase PhoE
MPTVFFITHPDVMIKPSVPVPDWPLNERGRARMRAIVAASWVKEVCSIFASSERKAREGAQILADGLGLGGYVIVDDLCENDRSATGYLPKQEFEAMVDAFFAQPQTRSEVGSRRQTLRRVLFVRLSGSRRKPPAMAT